ncbi:MAG: electron transfer flavoprotein alpha/beta subunit [Dehalococcoidia bacterium]|nr:electron transfer flavoprotein alpha/beta subunit [Dehalococcoidia bacterium]
MKIVVCIKQVPTIADLKFDMESKRVIREGVPLGINTFDRRAITEAIRIKKEHGAEVVAMTMGPPQAKDALVECLALGADKAIHLLDMAFAGSDTLATSKALALAIKKEGFDLLLLGMFSVDAETGQVGPEVAELLDIPQISGAIKIEFNSSLDEVTVERETDEGYETIRSRLPVLVMTQERLNTPIRAEESALAAARERPIEIMTAADLSPDPSIFGQAGSPTSVAEIRIMSSTREKMVIDGDNPTEAAEKLAQYLVSKGVFGPWKRQDTLPKRAKKRDTNGRGNGRAVWTVAEVVQNQVRGASLELLGKGAELADTLDGELAAVLIGNGLESHARTLTAHGADRVYLVEHDALAHYSPEAYAGALAEAITAHKPYIVLVPSTVRGRDFTPRVAARLGLGLTGDCVGLDIDGEGRLVQLKPAFGGNVVAPILSRTVPQMATVRAGTLTKLEPDWNRETVIERMSPRDIRPARTTMEGAPRDLGMAIVGLDSARTVVGVGMGIGGPENLPVVQKLADLFGAPLGSTRRVGDVGWLPGQHQIGLTGKVLAPQLYISVGVRGAFNHIIGVQKAEIVVGINNDPKAEIFENCDFGIVGDWAQVVPAVTDALTRAKERAGK